MTAISLDQSFVRVLKTVHGPRTQDWLHRIDSLVPAIEKRFKVRVTGQVAKLSRNLVLWAETPGAAQVVIKCAPPGGELRAEATALRIYNGEGACQLLDHWPDSEALMIERLSPGAPLNTLRDDQQAIAAAAALLPSLWRPVPLRPTGARQGDFARTFRETRAAFSGGSCPIEPALIDRAEKTFAHLNRTMGPPRMIHGDLYFENILSSARRPWLAIDPRGTIGDPAFDAGILASDPSDSLIHAADPMKVLAKRLTLVPDLLGLSRERVAGYAFVQTVRIACTMVRDGHQGHAFYREMAKALGRLIFNEVPARPKA
jgi:streptomycin 6-kinase